MAQSPDREQQRITLAPHAHHAPDGGEWEMVQEILQQVPAGIGQDFLLHYYISAKSWPLVLLLGRAGIGKRRLFQLLAGGITGCMDGRIHLLPAQSTWQERSGNVGGAESRPSLETIQGRFNTMAFLDLLAEATMPANEGQTYFLALDQATPSELAEYMDLYLIGQPANGGPPPLPPNIFLTAIVPLAGGSWRLPAALLDRVGIVEVNVPLDEPGPSPPHCPPVGWQRLLLRSMVRAADPARERLRRFGCLHDLEHLLDMLRRDLGPALDPSLEEDLLLYAANSFTTDGKGLLNLVGGTNIRQAVDLQLAQRLLPCIAQRAPRTAGGWTALVERFEGIFPWAHARARRILLESNAAEGFAIAESAEVALSSAPSERGNP